MKKMALIAGIPLMLSACVAVPVAPPPAGYPGSVAYEYYPDYGYYYGTPYPAYYGGAVGYYNWGYWHGRSGEGRWGRWHGR